jgi:hypothetical protein
MRRRSLLVAMLMGSLLATMVPGPVSAEMDENGVYPMIFPVQGPNTWTPNFGACRGTNCSRSHEGQDIMTFGVKGVPVVAVAAGEVMWYPGSQSECCYLGIRHDDGWVTRYIHLNNDRQNANGTYTDDGLGWGIASGIGIGTWVEAGQLIGWVGDSGNAEGVSPHLHFELRRPNGNPHGVAVDPTESLRAAIPVPNQEPPCPDGVETCDTIAFQESSGRFQIWDELVWGADTSSFYYGVPGDVPFSGDWDCDGVETLGLYRRSNGYAYLRNSNSQGVADNSFFFGVAGDFPVAGDFDGDGCDTVSIYRPSEGRFYITNQLGSDDVAFVADYSFLFGVTGDKPFVGDFDGDGVDTIGLHRESSGLVYFRNSNTSGFADAEFLFGIARDVLVAGDWDGDGDDTVGVYRRSEGRFYVKLENAQGFADAAFYAGQKSGLAPIFP